MMFRLSTLAVAVSGFVMHVSADQPGWRTVAIHDTFHAEGASVGDIDGDGHVDLVEGPLWHQGPEFTKSFEIAEPTAFPISRYSDQFFSKVFDANGDGANDVLVLGFPGKEARLYINPGRQQLGSHWAMHIVTGPVDNESPFIVDFIPGGLPEIVCGNGGRYGYYEAGDNATQPWTWTPITDDNACGGRFAHAMGVGDVNGDGLLDILDRKFWWEHPASGDAATQAGRSGDRSAWKKRVWALDGYGGGGAQICVTDMDGDGDSDIVTSYNAHGYGLGWFEQLTIDRFVRHDIMGESSTENPYGVAFSQLHAVALADIDGDGRQDIVTGKRYYAHGGKDAGGLQEPVLYWFRNTSTEESGDAESTSTNTGAPLNDRSGDRHSEPAFVPHLIDNNSGVGVDLLVADLNGDNKHDVVTASKKGLVLHFRDDALASIRPEKWQLTEGRDQSKYANGYEPAAAAENMLVPDGFHVDLIASEPELTQPIAMCFDAKGRLWVIEGHTYPQKAPAGQGRDRIIVFEDSDANGSFETKKVFAEGINLASGIEVGFGGVWVGAAPELLFYPDADHDCIPDGEPTVLLDGWHYEDTHETLNSFTWGPDGWLYGCHGVFTHSVVGKPGANDDERQRINAGVWRYHPTRHEFEVFAHGTSNPWGLDYDENGEWFVEACVIPHLFHIVQGARYRRQAGQHFNPYTYDDVKTIADHAHYTGGTFDVRKAMGTTEGVALGTSMLGGGHAHCGFAFYNGDVFPNEYRGDVFFHNLHGHRLVREKLEREGSGFVGRHRPDFALSQDHQQIGVTVLVGPDGALYTSDWHDPQTCHNRTPEIWNRADGRLFRIRYGDVKPVELDLWAESSDALIKRIAGSNTFVARQAQRVLLERFAAGNVTASDLEKLVRSAVGAGDQPQTSAVMQRYFRLLAATGLSQPDLLEATSEADPYLRRWGVYFIGERKERLNERTKTQIVELAKTESNRTVRREIASLLQRIPEDQRWEIIEALTTHHADVKDRNIPYLVWYGLEPLVPSDTARALHIADRSGWPDLLRFVIRRAAATQEGREQLVAVLADRNKNRNRALILEELLTAAKSRGGVEMPSTWPNAFSWLYHRSDTRIVNLTRELAVQFGDDSVLPFYRLTLGNPKAAIAQRIAAVRILAALKDPTLPSQLASFVAIPEQKLRAEVIRAMASYNDPTIPQILIDRFSQFDDSGQTAALNTLVSRGSYASELVAAMESKAISADSVPAFIVRQATTLGDDDLTKRLENVWGKIGTSSADMQAEYSRYRNMLRGRSFEQANRSNGRVLYDKNCGKCHKLFDSGGAIGPNITGANRTDKNYWLENILEPNSLIGKAYQTTTFVLSDGRVVSGLIADENDEAVTVQTATDKLVISKIDVEDRVISAQSLMPEGQLKTMSDQQVRELIAYLMSPSQAPLPGAAASPKSGPSTPAGAIEGETLAASAKVSGGTARPQGMSGFGPHWTGNSHLWWTGGQPDDTIEFSITPEKSGRFDVTMQLTRAHDYATVRIAADVLETKEVDLYDTTVSLAEPVTWQNVALVKGEPIRFTIAITGKNDAATPRYMVGLDFVQLAPAE